MKIKTVKLTEAHTVTVKWNCRTGCGHEAVFTSVLGAENAQARALRFIAESPRDTAYTLVHPVNAR